MRITLITHSCCNLKLYCLFDFLDPDKCECIRIRKVKSITYLIGSIRFSILFFISVSVVLMDYVFEDKLRMNSSCGLTLAPHLFKRANKFFLPNSVGKASSCFLYISFV